jgi:hypothetical protein
MALKLIDTKASLRRFQEAKAAAKVEAKSRQRRAERRARRNAAVALMRMSAHAGGWDALVARPLRQAPFASPDRCHMRPPPVLCADRAINV